MTADNRAAKGQADWFWFVAKTNTVHPPTLSNRRPNWFQRVYMGVFYGATAVYL